MSRKSSSQSRAEQLTKDGNSAKDDGDLISARKGYEAALRLVPNLPAAMLGLAAVEGREGNLAAAEALLRAVIAGSAPSSARAEAYIALANALFSLSRWDEAFESYASVLNLDVQETYPGEWEWLLANAYGGMGAVESRRGNIEAAVDLNLMALKHAPNHAAVLANLAFCYEEMGRSPEAMRALNEALRLEPDRGDWWRILGDIYRDAGDMIRARRSYQRAIDCGEDGAAEAFSRLPPETGAEWYEAGRDCEIDGDAEWAARCFRRALILGDMRAEAELRRLEDEKRP